MQDCVELLTCSVIDALSVVNSHLFNGLGEVYTMFKTLVGTGKHF